MCRPKAVGTLIEQGRSMAVVELAKSIVSVRAPLSGEVLRINEALSASPELIERDPYGEGWLLEIRPAQLQAERVALVDGANAKEAMEHYGWLNQLNGQ
jgi:glycine cleavage system H protein